ncbi:MAG: adenylate/guanylate cyclase domain-containing protein [Phototrophicaceae bacterium]
MADNDSQQGSGTKLREVSKQLNDVVGLLRNQRDMLRQRGINMPSSSLDSLRALKKRLDVLQKAMTEGQQSLRSLRALADTTALINSAQKTDEVLNQVMDTVIALTGAERGYIVLKNPDTGELEFRIARGMEQSTLDSSQGMIVSKTIVNMVADTGNPVLTDNASQDSRYDSQESVVGLQLRSILAVPLKSRGEILGVVYCDNRFLQGLFKQSELAVLTAFSNQAAVAIENARLFEATQTRLQEVTELRDRMMNLFTSIASGVLTVNQDEQVLVCNATMQQIAHVDNDIIGENIKTALPNMPQTFYDIIASVRVSGEQVTRDIDVQVNGFTRNWTIVASQLRGDNDTQGIAMVIDDMTEQKKSESQLIEARRYLPEALVRNMSTLDVTKIESQEREISAMFADVRGFTSFSENLEPEELMRVINKYLSIASDSIGLFEGIVDKYMGDAVTGLWNTQLNPQLDHANRAVQAAMQLVLDLHAMHEILPDNEQLFYGIGVHTGEAVLGNVGSKGRKEFAALGNATDVCKFLQEQAGPGEVIISQATFDIVGNSWECERLTKLVREKKGYEDVVCYRVLKRIKGQGITQAFVDDELLALLAQENDD